VMDGDGSGGGLGEMFTLVKLDRPGNILPLNEELLVVDDRQVHTYLLWDSAQRVLLQRIEADPADASNSVTYAELAFRAGKTELVIDATDNALAAIEQDPLSLRNDTARARLFRALLDMIDPPLGARIARELTLPQRREVLQRLELTASTPRETVAYLMVAGSLAESEGEPARAVDAYQRILQSPSLAGTMHFDQDRSVPADTEATSRLRSLIEVFSRDIYRSYDGEADRALAAMEHERDPGAFESVARRYPVATSSPRAWQLAADRYERQGLSRFVTSALDEGLRVARDVLEPGDALTAEIAGLFVTQLMKSSQYERALAMLTGFERAGTLGVLTVRGVPTDGLRLLASVRRTILRRDQRPRIGEPMRDPTTLLGWALFNDPDVLNESVPTNRIPMISTDGNIAIFGKDDAGEIRMLWGGVEQARESIVRFSTAGVLFATRDAPSVIDRSYILRDLDTGTVLWKTQPFFSHFDAIDTSAAGRPSEPGRPVPRFDTPLQSNIRATTLIQDRKSVV